MANTHRISIIGAVIVCFVGAQGNATLFASEGPFLTLSASDGVFDFCDLGTVGNNWRSTCAIAARCDASTTCV